MSLFNPELPKKEKKEPKPHPWSKTIKHTYTKSYKYGHNSAKNPIFPIKKEEVDSDRIKITVIGNRVKKEFIFCYYLAKFLHKYRRKKFEPPLIRGVSSVEWPKAWNDLKLEFGGFAFCIDSQVAVLVNDKFLGGDKEFKKFIGAKYIYHLCIDYYKEGIQQFANYIKSSGRPCAYMQMAIGDKEIGTMIFMLYSDIVPLTCENFLRLCEAPKGGYAGTPVHRIVTDGWIQCGGFSLKDDPDLDCENFIIPHDKRGVLCMANADRHIECSTQFFVLLQPAPWMAHKYVAFGQLIEGEATLKKIENVPTWYESPTQDITIFKCGIFNMDCHWIPINKNTHEYIHSHIENLFEIGELFYEELIQNVFMEIQFKRIQQMTSSVGEEEQSEAVKNIHETKRFIRKKDEIEVHEREHKHVPSINDASTSFSGTVNREFDVDEYKYEFEDFSFPVASKVPSEMLVKPEKPYYIPLTDVPDPEEVKSDFNLLKILKGDLCHVADLEPDQEKRRAVDDQRRISIPETLVCALFECFEDDDYSDASLDSDEEAEIKNYLKENGDSTSFAGRIVKKIANLPQKYAIFDTEYKAKTTRNHLTDDEIRITRMAESEYMSTREKKVSISLSASKLSHMKIQRRPTGFVRMEDLASIHGIHSQTFESLEEETDSDGEVRKVKIVAQSVSDTRRRSSLQDKPRPSVLARLYFDVSQDDDNEGPTLKDYKPSTEQKSFIFLTKSETHNFREDSHDRMMERLAAIESQQSINHILNLQYGNKISRKISYDYVGTIRRMEDKQDVSLRSLDFAKKRPSMSVLQYKKQNKLYQEQMQNSSKTCPEPEKRYDGLRLPGDSPLYLGSKDDLRSRKSYIGRLPW